VDSYYKSRREHGIVVALACHEPEESCFCTVFGIDPADPSKAKADVAAWMIDGKLYWKPITEKGEALTAKVKDLFEEEDADAKVEEEKAYIEGIAKQLPNAELSLDGWGAGKTDEKFKSEVWDKVYKGCLGCGTCTFVCPTCQCYDIKDYTTKNGIQRYRCWDSCMYSDFTLMAGGQNRQTQLQRFRQRFMHKLVYYPTNNDGMFMCVGCGRCVEKCPQSLNIVKVIKAFEENK
jgi:heterodisulfide reductase subunit C